MSSRTRTVQQAAEPFDPRWALSPGDYRQSYAHIPFDESDERTIRSLHARALDAPGCTPAAPPLPPAKAMPARRNAAKQATKKKPTAP